LPSRPKTSVGIEPRNRQDAPADCQTDSAEEKTSQDHEECLRQCQICGVHFCLSLFLFYPIRLPEFARDGGAEIRPPVGRGVEAIFEPAFRFARPQEIENSQKDDEGQNAERKSQRDVSYPHPENKRQEIRRGGRRENVFPIALINAEAF
jgi:hypothetical protein